MDRGSNLSGYLNKLNEDKLLTKEEELRILRRIEEVQDKLLSKCIQYKFFRNELASYLDDLPFERNAEIRLVSRRLNQGSTNEECREMKKTFRKLRRLLRSDEDRKETRRSMKELRLTGNHVHSLVKQVKAKYKMIDAYSDLRKRMFRYFEVERVDKLRQICAKVREDVDYRSRLAKDFYTDEVSLLSRVSELDELDSLAKSLRKQGLNLSYYRQLQGTFNVIKGLEDQMRKDRDELIRRNLRLVVSRARKFQNKGLDLEDLIQEGSVGLMKAINRHDSSRGVKVATYATWWIDQAIRRGISNKSRTIRLPTHVEVTQMEVGQAMHSLYHKLGRAPTKEEIVEQTGLKPEVVDNVFNVSVHETSIDDQPIEDASMREMSIGEASEDNPYEIISDKMMREKVRKVLGRLKPRSEKILRMRFGIGEPYDADQTLKTVAESFGLSKERIRVIQNKAMKELRKGGLDDEV